MYCCWDLAAAIWSVFDLELTPSGCHSGGGRGWGPWCCRKISKFLGWSTGSDIMVVVAFSSKSLVTISLVKLGRAENRLVTTPMEWWIPFWSTRVTNFVSKDSD
jgi:hypothetical protein